MQNQYWCVHVAAPCTVTFRTTVLIASSPISVQMAREVHRERAKTAMAITNCSGGSSKHQQQLQRTGDETPGAEQQRQQQQSVQVNLQVESAETGGGENDELAGLVLQLEDRWAGEVAQLKAEKLALAQALQAVVIAAPPGPDGKRRSLQELVEDGMRRQ